MMKKVLIIEDEPINAGRLKRQIADIDDTLTIDGPLTSVDGSSDKSCDFVIMQIEKS